MALDNGFARVPQLQQTYVHKITNAPVFKIWRLDNHFDGGKSITQPLKGVGPHSGIARCKIIIARAI